MPQIKSETGVKSEPTSASLGTGQRQTLSNAGTKPIKKEQDKKDVPPPPPTTYRDIPLFSTNSGSWVTHIMKFAHHTRVDPNDAAIFIPPLKLNRKNPPRLKLPRPKPGDAVIDKYGKPMMGKDGQPLAWPAPGEDLGRIEEVIKKQPANKAAGADQSLVAPGSLARPPKAKLFTKKVKEVHKASDSARRTMKKEYFPWVLEDFETSEEWESSRMPIPTGTRALENWIDELKAKGQQAELNKDGDIDMISPGTIKVESNVKQEKGAQGSVSHSPWIGKLEGDSNDNSLSHHVLFVFDERDAGGFKVVPVSRMYKFLQKPKHSTMTNEQVEQEFQKFQKTREMDRWALRNRRADGPSSSTVKAEDAAAWSSWSQVNSLSLPSGGSFGGGRRRNLMAVHGGELLRDDEDEGASKRKMKEDEGGAYDEVDYEEEFADDEEKMDDGDPYAEDEETRELEERLKREMAKANRVGDDGDEVDQDGADEDNNDQVLTGSGRQMMKIMRSLARRDGNEIYEKDDDEINPYASDESEDEDESYVANPEKAMQIAREEREKREKEAVKNKGKGTPAPVSGSSTPTGRQEKKPQTLVQPPLPALQQRPGAGHANLAQRATSPTRATSSKISSRQASRSSSPARADSLVDDGAGTVSPSGGVKRKPESPATPHSGSMASVPSRPDPKRVKTATGSRAGSPSGSPPGSKSGSRAGSPGVASAPRAPTNAVEAEIIQLVREGKIANTSELVHHFRKRLKTEPQIKELLSAAVRKVAVMDKATNKLKLKEGF